MKNLKSGKINCSAQGIGKGAWHPFPYKFGSSVKSCRKGTGSPLDPNCFLKGRGTAATVSLLVSCNTLNLFLDPIHDLVGFFQQRFAFGPVVWILHIIVEGKVTISFKPLA